MTSAGRTRSAGSKVKPIGPPHAATSRTPASSSRYRSAYCAPSAVVSVSRHSCAPVTPASPIAHIEHGNVLLLLDEARNEDAAAEAYERAAQCKPLDAMEALDAAWAADQLA